MNSEATIETGGGLIAVKQAAQLLSVSTRTVWRMIADGELTRVRVRSCTRLLKEEIANRPRRIK
jgi:excisionase family DNA binding protein